MRAAAIVCPGPSLDPSIIPTLHEQCEMVVACNRGFKAWAQYPHLNPHAVYFMDGPHRFSDCIREIRELDTVFFTPTQVNTDQKWKHVGRLKTVYGLRIDDDAKVEDKSPFEGEKLTRPLKTTSVAWQHLVRFGFDLVAIAGCDGRCDPEQRYFFESEKLTHAQHTRQFRSYGEVVECFRHWLPYAQERGVQTVNLSGEASALSNHMPSIGANGISKCLQELQQK